MGGGRNYYNVEDYQAWKREQGKGSRIPPRVNYLTAVNRMRNLLDGKKITWAALGGLAMMCLGSRRELEDVHLVYDDKDFSRIKLKLGADNRIRLPQGMNALFPAKVLVATGPKYKDVGCLENFNVEVNMVPTGSAGTPTSDVLFKNMGLLSLDIDGKTRTVKGLNLLYLMRTSLQFYKERSVSWDPRLDVLFLCRNYGKQLNVFQGQFNQKEIQENFLSTSFFARLSQDDQKRCYQVLLGMEPPPKMTMTPPLQPNGHRQTAPGPGFDYNGMQLSKENSNPPQSAQPKPSRPKSVPIETTLNQSNAGGGPRSQAVPVSSTTRTEPRGRYRPVSAQHMTSMPQNSVHIAGNAQPRKCSQHVQPAVPSYKAQPFGVQHVNNTKPQIVQGSGSVHSMEAQPRSSMPKMSHIASVPSNTYGPISQNHVNEESRHPSDSAPLPSPNLSSIPLTKQEEESPPPPSTGGLKLVGPEGLYPAPLKSKSPPRSMQDAPTASTRNEKPAREQPPLVLELDGGPFQYDQKTTSQLNQFVAELPATSSAPPSMLDSSTVVHELPSAPVVKPHITSPAVNGSDDQHHTAQPHNARSQSAPVNNMPLPASLMIGQPGPGAPQKHHTSTQHSIPPNYHSVYSPPSFQAKNPSPPNPAPSSTYKAYSGPISLPVLPATTAPLDSVEPPATNLFQKTAPPPNFSRPTPSPPNAASNSVLLQQPPPPIELLTPGGRNFAAPPPPPPTTSLYNSYNKIIPNAGSGYIPHQRNLSSGSRSSHNSEQLAEEYQQTLPDYENGYGSSDEAGGGRSNVGVVGVW